MVDFYACVDYSFSSRLGVKVLPASGSLLHTPVALADGTMLCSVTEEQWVVSAIQEDMWKQIILCFGEIKAGINQPVTQNQHSPIHDVTKMLISQP